MRWGGEGGRVLILQPVYPEVGLEFELAPTRNPEAKRKRIRRCSASTFVPVEATLIIDNGSKFRMIDPNGSFVVTYP